MGLNIIIVIFINVDKKVIKFPSRAVSYHIIDFVPQNGPVLLTKDSEKWLRLSLVEFSCELLLFARHGRHLSQSSKQSFPLVEYTCAQQKQ